MKASLAILILLALLSTTDISQAIDLTSKFFPRRIDLANNALVLNGSGYRKVTFFRITVYAMGLYLPERSQDPQRILASNSLKKLLLRFVRSVSKETLYAALEESVRDNYPDWQNLQAELLKLRSHMPDVQSGDSIEFNLYPEALHIKHNHSSEVRIPGSNLQTAILSIWLGSDPAGEDLKDALLGNGWQ